MYVYSSIEVVRQKHITGLISMSHHLSSHVILSFYIEFIFKIRSRFSADFLTHEFTKMNECLNREKKHRRLLHKRSLAKKRGTEKNIESN